MGTRTHKYACVVYRSRQPWYRVATILVSLGKHQAAEQSIAKGLKLTSDPEVRKTLTALRSKNNASLSKIEASAETKPAVSHAHLLRHDVLFLIAQEGLLIDPAFNLRMAGVSTEWRATILHHSSLWDSLRIGRRRPVAKVAHYLERSRGRLREIVVSEDVEGHIQDQIAAMLVPCIENVQRLQLGGSTRAFIEHWRGRCMHLKSIHIGNPHKIPVYRSGRGRERSDDDDGPLVSIANVAHELLHPDAKSLEVVEAERVSLRRPQDGNLFPYAHMNSLRRLCLSGGLVRSAGSVATILRHAPKLEVLRCGLTWIGPYMEDEDEHEDELVYHPNLRSLDLLYNCEGLSLLRCLELPNVTELRCFSWHPSLPNNFLGLLRGPAFVAALPKLTVLDIGRQHVNQRDLVDTLKSLTSLRFLNVSFVSLDNDFVEALVVHNATPLLPSLTALSIAGNGDISAGPIRRLVLSRNREVYPKPAAPACPPPRRSAFAPARLPPKAATPVSAPNPRAKVPPISWLCLDGCDNPHMDVQVLQGLKKEVRFISYNGSSDIARVCGKGAWPWDKGMQWTDDCASGPDGCHIKRNGESQCLVPPLTLANDEWYLHHTCTARIEEVEA